MRRWIALPALLALLALPTAADTDELDAMKRRVAALKAGAGQWRDVNWKTCLRDGFLQARKEKRPVLIWALGGDPTGRC